jgi:hypothetical protein
MFSDETDWGWKEITNSRKQRKQWDVPTQRCTKAECFWTFTSSAASDSTIGALYETISAKVSPKKEGENGHHLSLQPKKTVIFVSVMTGGMFSAFGSYSVILDIYID